MQAIRAAVAKTGLSVSESLGPALVPSTEQDSVVLNPILCFLIYKMGMTMSPLEGNELSHTQQVTCKCQGSPSTCLPSLVSLAVPREVPVLKEL